MSGIHKIREELHNKVLRLRSIESVVSSDKFERLWEVSNDAEKEKVSKLIEKADRLKVSDWVKTHPSISYGEMGVISLKRVAQRMRIPHYSRLTQTELIQAIEAKEKSDGKKQK